MKEIGFGKELSIYNSTMTKMEGNTEEKCAEEQLRGRMMAQTIALSAVIVLFIALLGRYLSFALPQGTRSVIFS
ncbi:UNVERIFIED_CONTAM: hypothetical protein ABIC26_003692 [Paenibacillus sp. PvR008]